MARPVWFALVLGFFLVGCGSSQHGDRRAFLVAAENGDVAGVRRELEAGVRPDAVFNINDPTALYLAATNGQAEVVRLLLDAGADPTATFKGSSLKTEVLAFHARIKNIQSDPGAPSGKYRKQDGTIVDLRDMPLHEDAYEPILKMIEDAAHRATSK